MKKEGKALLHKWLRQIKVFREQRGPRNDIPAEDNYLEQAKLVVSESSKLQCLVGIVEDEVVTHRDNLFSCWNWCWWMGSSFTSTLTFSIANFAFHSLPSKSMFAPCPTLSTSGVLLILGYLELLSNFLCFSSFFRTLSSALTRAIAYWERMQSLSHVDQTPTDRSLD